MGGRESTTLPNPRERDKQPKQTPKQTPTTPTTTYLDERVTSGVEDFVFEVRGRQRRDRGRGKSTATQQQQHKERRHGTAQHIDVMDGICSRKENEKNDPQQQKQQQGGRGRGTWQQRREREEPSPNPNPNGRAWIVRRASLHLCCCLWKLERNQK